MSFALVAARRGEHWKLHDDEANAWGTALANVLQHVNLPERELGIAADIAAVGFVAYATVESRIAIDRRNALGAAQHSPVPAAPRAPVAAPDPSNMLDTVGLERMQQAIAARLNGEPLDLANPAHVELLNELASEGLHASGPALGTHEAPVYPPFNPEINGAQINDPTVIEGLGNA